MSTFWTLDERIPICKSTYMSPIVNPVREVSAFVNKGCASSIALYLAQIPLMIGLMY
jgi:hypothetical protein